MALWILKVNNEEAYIPKYDVMVGCIVRAKTEEMARELASKHRGDETSEVWLRSDWSTCSLLSPSGKDEFILNDFRAG